MAHIYTQITGYLWAICAIYWFVASRSPKTPAYFQPRKDRLIYFGQICLTFLLLYAAPLYVGPFSHQIWPANEFFGVVGGLLTLMGLFYAVLANVYLNGHGLIQSGPYAVTRHPIYTGGIAAVFGTALTVGQVRSVLAVVIIVYTLSLKIKFEEAFMRAEFKEYDEYARRVKRLIPYIY